MASNICKDKHRFNITHSYINLDDVQEFCASEPEKSILEEVLKLPDKYKTVLHLFYVEGYKTSEISELLGISGAAVRKRLQYGRELLKIEHRRDDVL